MTERPNSHNTDSSDVKVIPYYLPQFHTIPENDKAWGKGFTEWTNVKKAVPLFEGHYQPRVPLNENYYCLLDDGVMESQAELAKKYGIYGFCYYHYWFRNGHKLLEKPLEKMLHNPKIDIPFCLCWANENWTRRWDGGDNEIIIAQDYDDMKNLEHHIDYLCEFFADPRYIKEDGKPFFIIYKPDIIPNIKNRVRYIRERVMKNGFPGIVIAAQYPSFRDEYGELKDFGVDAYIQFEPLFCEWGLPDKFDENRKKVIKRTLKKILDSAGMLKPLRKLKSILSHKPKAPDVFKIFEYSRAWEKILSFSVEDRRIITGAFKDWDNTPRKAAGYVCQGVTPEKFREYMTRLVKKVREEYTRPYIFLNAWNEWGEGSYIEPDERYGYAYLEALRDALNS